jgi:penicillin-insensitive murein endopeptidase
MLVAMGAGLTGPASAQDGDSQSIGYADEGRLEVPFALATGDELVSVRQHRYGTREMVELLHRAARAVAREHPGARLAVGDISSATGGPLSPHQSHQAGRDVDVGFYVTDQQGRPLPQSAFVMIAADGTGRRGGTPVEFDDARNWAFLVALVDDPGAEVQHVLIASHLRERLFEHARRIHAPADQVRRVQLVTDPIRGSERHDDHFHIRIYCSVGDRPQCHDRPPLHPWYYGTPSPAAVAAARAADLQRAAALRREQEIARLAEEALARGREREEALEEARARELELEPARQADAERRRAAALSRDERQALLALRAMELRARRERTRGTVEERGRAAQLSAEERRWEEAERRRAAALRASLARTEAEARRREAAERARVAALVRRAEAQAAADRRRARELTRQSERIERTLGTDLP